MLKAPWDVTKIECLMSWYLQMLFFFFCRALFSTNIWWILCCDDKVFYYRQFWMSITSYYRFGRREKFFISHVCSQQCYCACACQKIFVRPSLCDNEFAHLKKYIILNILLCKIKYYVQIFLLYGQLNLMLMTSFSLLL